MTDATGERIDRLEMRIAFQDKTIDELNAVVTEQWRVIDGLSAKLKLLEEHARSAGSSVADPRSEPPPPHY